MTGIVDRDEPCRHCGAIAGRELADGAIECVTCGSVAPDPFVVAKRSLGVSSR
ncbi:hypothetical protein [Halorubrum sp. HHNYT27]|uniref:hypothetical protein n=1 Tax=Halorubrum sp. HHNYT27 TaxID=3402275 RepID=UPI003EBC3007